MAKKKIRIGIVGTGFARLTQIPAFLECEGTEVVSVASSSIANAESAARHFGIGHYTDDWKETVARDEIDLVSITAPPNLHHEMAMYALGHGKNVLCEKPMAINAAEALEMTLAAEKAGLLALIDHELRFLNGRRKAHEIIRNGEIGKIIHCKAMFRNASRGTQAVPWNWWSDAGAGGGALGAIGSHIIDSFRWLTGTVITDVCCRLKTNIKERKDQGGSIRSVTSDDEANLLIRFADAALCEDASGAASMSVVEASKYDFVTEVFGTEGSIVIGESGQLRFAKMGERDWREIKIDLGKAPAGTKVGGWSRGFLGFAREIVAALREGQEEIEHAATFRDGLEVQMVLDAARESDNTGCTARL